MDAQVAYGFHHLRDEKPYLAQGPVANKVPLKSSYGVICSVELLTRLKYSAMRFIIMTCKLLLFRSSFLWNQVVSGFSFSKCCICPSIQTGGMQYLYQWLFYHQVVMITIMPCNIKKESGPSSVG